MQFRILVDIARIAEENLGSINFSNVGLGQLD